MKDFVTEKEALKKVCPYSWSLSTVDSIKGFTTCEASRCMAWRWSHADSGPTGEATGFCGAFGLPKYV